MGLGRPGRSGEPSNRRPGPVARLALLGRNNQTAVGLPSGVIAEPWPTAPDFDDTKFITESEARRLAEERGWRFRVQ
jgi:hypothetical protein